MDVKGEIHGDEGSPLSEENDKLIRRIWQWFVDEDITNKPEPSFEAADYLPSDIAGLHDPVEHKVVINQQFEPDEFPLAVFMVEEILHYVTSSDDMETSADFSPKFLSFIKRLLRPTLTEAAFSQLEAKWLRTDEREYQSLLVGELWKVIKAES